MTDLVRKLIESEPAGERIEVAYQLGKIVGFICAALAIIVGIVAGTALYAIVH